MKENFHMCHRLTNHISPFSWISSINHLYTHLFAVWCHKATSAFVVFHLDRCYVFVSVNAPSFCCFAKCSVETLFVI